MMLSINLSALPTLRRSPTSGFFLQGQRTIAPATSGCEPFSCRHPIIQPLFLTNNAEYGQAVDAMRSPYSIHQHSLLDFLKPGGDSWKGQFPTS